MATHTSGGRARRQLGLTQQDLAMYLRISRDQLGQVEIGRRSLPLVASQRLQPLLALLDRVAGEAAAPEPPLAPSETDPAHEANAELVEQVRRRRRAARHEAGNARYQLSLLLPQPPALRRRVVVLTALQAALPAVPPAGEDDPDAWDRLWYRYHIGDAEDKLTKCGTLSQALLKARILALDTEIAVLEKLLPPASN